MKDRAVFVAGKNVAGALAEREGYFGSGRIVVARLWLGEQEVLDLIQRGGEFITVGAEDDAARVFVAQHVAAMFGHLAEGLGAFDQQNAIAVAESFHSAFLRGGGVFALSHVGKASDHVGAVNGSGVA